MGKKILILNKADLLQHSLLQSLAGQQQNFSIFTRKSNKILMLDIKFGKFITVFVVFSILRILL